MARKNQLTTSDPLSFSEYTRLLDCLHNDGRYIWEMYARLSFCTACRVSDVLKLRWNDILNKSAIVVTEQKTGKTRRIPFNPSVQQKFKELYELLDRPDKKDYVFVSRGERDTHFTCQYVNRMLKQFKKDYKLSVNHFSTHTFRKTFGRYVYDTHDHSAESLILLNKIFKHHSIEITKTYIGITQEEISSIYESIQF